MGLTEAQFQAAKNVAITMWYAARFDGADASKAMKAQVAEQYNNRKKIADDLGVDGETIHGIILGVAAQQIVQDMSNRGFPDHQRRAKQSLESLKAMQGIDALFIYEALYLHKGH